MKLREKFKLAYCTDSFEQQYKNYEKVASDLAIDFADWCASEEAQSLIEDLMIVGEINKVPETKELLKIYKKEKGL